MDRKTAEREAARKHRMPTPIEFRQGYEAFQRHEYRDAVYKTAAFLVDHFWGEPERMADGVGALLLSWNQAFYRYGVFDFVRLEEALRRNMETLKGFRNRNIRSLMESDEPVIKRLFLEFLDALQIKEGTKRGQRSPVASGKALHILAPDFLTLWDEKIAKAYGTYYKPDPERKYLVFAYKMQELARELDPHVPTGCGRTFLKLIDEYNYARYTKGWV